MSLRRLFGSRGSDDQGLEPYSVEATVIGHSRREDRKVSGQITDERFEAQAGRVIFDNANVRDVDFSTTRFDSFLATASEFVECSFDKTEFGAGELGSSSRQTTYRRCSFQRSVFGDVRPGNARFEGCEFVDLMPTGGWFAYCAEFVDCSFSRCLEGVVFSGVPFNCGELDPPRRTNEFIGNDFSHAIIHDCRFVFGIDLRSQSLPADDDHFLVSDIQSRLVAAKEELREIGDPAIREEATAMLEAVALESEGQQDLFTHRENWDVFSQETQAAVWASLMR